LAPKRINTLYESQAITLAYKTICYSSSSMPRSYPSQIERMQDPTKLVLDTSFPKHFLCCPILEALLVFWACILELRHP